MVAKVNSASVRARALAALPVVIGFAVFVTALEVLRLELHTVSWHEVSSDVLSIPLPYLLLALAITACNYLVLAGYDVLAFKYVGRAVALGPVVGVSMLAYAVANSVGFAMLSGASIRYRFYSRWGVTAEELSRALSSAIRSRSGWDCWPLAASRWSAVHCLASPNGPAINTCPLRDGR
jgi:phosphatidylglycerol lysyltransferase